jgi:hypothetical protein
MYGFLLGTSYGVSAGLIVYGIERDYISEDRAFTYIMAWAIVGLGLAVLALIIRPKSGG